MLPFVPVWVPVVYTAVIALLFLIISRCVYINLIMPHYNTIIAARDTKYRIRNNKKIIKKIRHSIKKDDNDAIYGLESFDHKINDLHDSIEKTENEKQGALKAVSYTHLDVYKRQVIGSSLSAYVDDTTDFEFNQEYKDIIEKYAENIYRTISKKVKSLPSSSQTIRKNVIKEVVSFTPQESEQLSLIHI